ncbi:MAG: hypothetical protein IPM34_13415 [Saprospiraceae bacterium]|nr:hypothetical protein [Saprospiraceae bacterium]
MEFPTILLPASKSISNRLLIIQALGNFKNVLKNLSESDDTNFLKKALHDVNERIQIGEGGTTLRFVLSYFAMIDRRVVLEGKGLLRNRPLKPLLLLLEKMDCTFRFENEEYKIPLRIDKGIDKNYSDPVQMESGISSQFVSSILLIAPYFKHGLHLSWSEDGVSEPYIRMTLSLMKEFGIQWSATSHAVNVEAGSYKGHDYTVEADWSAAAFPLAWIALCDEAHCFFPNLKRSGLQADERILDFLKAFGVVSRETSDGIMIHKTKASLPAAIEFDFTECPDLFPALSIFCALQKINARFKGLHHLVHKESNRLQIISEFLTQCGVEIREIESDRDLYFKMETFHLDHHIALDSHGDHRIAMAFSLLYKLTPVRIAPEVVSKSFPAYWEEFEKWRRIGM